MIVYRVRFVDSPLSLGRLVPEIRSVRLSTFRSPCSCRKMGGIAAGCLQAPSSFQFFSLYSSYAELTTYPRLLPVFQWFPSSNFGFFEKQAGLTVEASRLSFVTQGRHLKHSKFCAFRAVWSFFFA